MSDSYEEFDYSGSSFEEYNDGSNENSDISGPFGQFIDSLTDEQFFSRFRMSKQTFGYIYDILDLPAKTRGDMHDSKFDLLIFLRYLATGSFMAVAGDLTTNVSYYADSNRNFFIL